MAIIANGINITNPIVSIGGVQQNIKSIYATHNGVDTLVWVKKNFLNIEYAENVITKAWLDIENDNKGTQIAVFSTRYAWTSSNTQTTTMFKGRRIINSNLTNEEVQNILNGFNIGSGVVGITRLEEAPAPSFSNKWYGYKANGDAVINTALGSTLTHIIQDCAPNFEGVNDIMMGHHTQFLYWDYFADYSVFGQDGKSPEIHGDDDIPGPVTEGPKDPGSIIYAEKAPEAGTIRVALDSTDRYSIRIYGQNNINGVSQEGPDYTTITKL